MFFRSLASSFLLSICFTSSAMAQSAPRIVSEPCKSAQSVSMVELDRKMMSLRATLDDLERARANLSSAAKAQREELDKKIRTNQEALIELTFTLECHRRDLQDDPVLITDVERPAPPTRGTGRGGQRGSTWTAITTYYATNREWTGKENYGSNRTQKLEYGRAEVSIPTSRQPGELPLPIL